jgi:LysM repeat protein
VQASLLANSSPAISDAIKVGQVVVVPAYYDVSTGRVTELPPLVGVTGTP